MAESQPQGELFQEDIYDAFRHAVKALGGAKKVGAKLWPEKPMDQAAQLLLHCLNPERPEKLDLYQIEWLLREANKKGCLSPCSNSPATLITTSRGPSQRLLCPRPAIPAQEKSERDVAERSGC